MEALRVRIGRSGAVRAAVMAAVLSLTLAGSGEAQVEGRIDALEKGRRSIGLALPGGGGGELTLWRMVSNGRNRGLTVRLSASADGSERAGDTRAGQRISLLAGPSFRRYLSRTAPVAPYFQTSVLLGGSYNRHTGDSPAESHVRSRWTAGGEIGAGIGAEWFVHRRASLGGHTGLRFNGFYGSDADHDHWRLELGTVSSALTLQIYF